MSLWERLLHTGTRPEIAYMLLIIGFFGLVFELYNPGIGAAGVLGGFCLVLGFYGLSVLPTSWTGAGLIVAGFALFVADLHRAGFGMFTLGGFASMLVGSVVMLSGEAPSLSLSWWLMALGLVGTLLFFISAMTAAVRARTAKPVPGAESLVGTLGIARTDIAPDGQVMARGTLWRARTVGMAIGQGTPVKILGVSGLLLMVEEADGQPESDDGRAR